MIVHPIICQQVFLHQSSASPDHWKRVFPYGPGTTWPSSWTWICSRALLRRSTQKLALGASATKTVARQQAWWEARPELISACMLCVCVCVCFVGLLDEFPHLVYSRVRFFEKDIMTQFRIPTFADCTPYSIQTIERHCMLFLITNYFTNS